MANSVTITLTTDKTVGNLRDVFVNTNPQLMLNNFQNYLSSIVSGSDAASFSMKLNTGNAIAASGTLTCSSVSAGNTASINGTTFTAVDDKEKTTVQTVADIAGSLNSKYFEFYSANNATHYYIWYNVNSAGVDPAIAGATGVMVALATGATATTVATATYAKFLLAPLSADFDQAAGNGVQSNFRNKLPGVTTDTSDTGSTGFSISISNQGAAVGANEFQVNENDTLDAAALKTLINASSSLQSVASSSASLGVVTVSAIQGGVQGNTITLSATGGITAGAARLSGGTDDTSASVYNFQR